MAEIKPIDLKAVKEADTALDRIAEEHPDLIDPTQAKWSEEEIKAMIVDPTKQTFSVEEVAEMLQSNVETIRKHIRRGDLKAAKIGKSYAVSRPELEKYFKGKGGGKLFEDAE